MLGQAAHQLRLAGAREAPEADDDRAGDELRQHVPGAQRIDHAIDDVVDAEELGLQRMGHGLQVARALGERRMQVGMDVVGHGGLFLLRMIFRETGTRPLPRERGGAACDARFGIRAARFGSLPKRAGGGVP